MATKRNCWLVKQEPEDYSWDDLVRDKETAWTGVRNFQARNNLRNMKTGDRVLFYHSGKEKSVVGIAEVARAGYRDPTANDDAWIAVDIKPLKQLPKPVSLANIRANAKLRDLLLVRQSRLSVMPVSKEDFEQIVRMSEKK
jgi:predicted RNA-binding protein with PUA-like domain